VITGTEKALCIKPQKTILPQTKKLSHTNKIKKKITKIDYSREN